MTPPVSSSGRWPAIALLLAGSVGVPGLVAVFEPEILRSPKTAIALLVLWEVFVLLGSIFAKVWGKLESRWVDRLTDWLDHNLQAVFSQYRRHYLKWIFYRHRDFDVKGLSIQSTYNLELEQVFVDLTLDPRPPHATSTNPFRPFPQELTGRRQIWDYLTNKTFTGCLVLIGAPGSGKTTLLKKMALRLTGRSRPKIRQNLPILLFLREHARSIRASPALSLADLASLDLARKQSPIQPPPVWFRKKLEAGRCLVLLDGLDEVASLEIRQQVGAWVESQISAFPGNRFLITSRPHGYRSCPISGATVLEVQPFNREQIRQFIHNWYRANETHASQKLDFGVIMKAREGSEDLLQRLGNSQILTELAVNPLLLTMIANVHRFRSKLPERRIELYAEICEVFLGKRQQARGIEMDLTPAQKQRVLQPLADRLMCTNRRDIPRQEAAEIISEQLRRVVGESKGRPELEFLKNIEHDSGLLLERESGMYSFAHLAFQEYLAAVHARECGLGIDLAGKIADPWWHEVIRLYGAQGDASSILEMCLSSDRPSVPVLTLAIDVLEEALEAAPEWRARIDGLLGEGVEDTDPERFRLAAETLLARRLKSMVAAGEGTFVDLSCITHAEYQLFLDQVRAVGRFHQPDHWNAYRFPSGQALRPAVGMRASDAQAFCEWLSERDSNFVFRLPTSREAEANGLFSAAKQTGTSRGYWLADGFHRVAAPHSVSRGYLEKLIMMDISEDPNRDRSLQRARAQAQDQDLALSQNIVRDCLRVRNGRNVRASTLVRALARTLHLAGAIFLDSVRSRLGSDPRVSAGTHVVDYDRELDLDRDLDGDLALDRDLDVDLGLGGEFDRVEERIEFHRIVRWMLRITSLYFALNASRDDERRFSSYISLAVLEARVDGHAPAGEAIRIVKEYRP